MSPVRTLLFHSRAQARGLARAALLLAPVVLIASLSHISLRRYYFPSGWLTAGALLVFALDWWRPVSSRHALHRRMDGHLFLGATLALLFAVHVDFRMPNGWIDLGLTVGFAMLLLSLAVGATLCRDDPAPAGGLSTRRAGWLVAWQRVHTALSFALLTLVGVHASLVHGHGLMAWLLLGKSS